MVKLKNISFLLFLILSLNVVGQDIHFTQYFFSPLNLNPAYTGRFDGDFRIVGNYRSQWAAVMNRDQFKTFSVSYEHNLEYANQQFSIGGVYAHDRNTVGHLQQNKLELSAAANRNFGNNYIGLGFQFGMLHKGVNYNAYLYPNQYDSNLGSFNSNLANLQNFANQNDYLFDFNAGVVYARKINDKFFPELGLSMHHINKPNESFLGAKNKLPSRYVSDLKLNYQLTEKILLVPNFLFMYQKKAQDLLWGALLRHKIAENNYNLSQIFGGASIRNGFNRNFDSFEMILGGVIGDFQVGMSYDVNVSDLSSLTNYRGAIEFSIIYVAKSAEPKIFIVPCDIL